MPQCAPMAGTLYIVSTPIGNLEDITYRALRILREVDVIACEDTRHTRKLLNHYGIDATTISYHEHNERERANELCAMLAAGKDLAVVADAGTPLISDPGFRVVNLAIEKGFRVVPIPGPTALVAALCVSGLASDQFIFAGFLPARTSARKARLEALRSLDTTLIFYEAPHRIVATLRDAAEILGNRQAVVARELTKLHEELARERLDQLVETFSNRNQVRGEIVLLIAGAQTANDLDPALGKSSHALTERVSELEGEGLNEKAALKKAARELGLKRDEAYRLMLAQKNRRNK
ncbi:MAG: 16S rRNA (cytidine(1402)-2'-O)-methyltransferase [Pyrinomonadaceae bacterium]